MAESGEELRGELREEIDRWVVGNGDRLRAWRRDFHSHPELSWKEQRTTDVIVGVLRDLGLDPRVLPGGTGAICDIGGQGERVALRADMDALPITEHTGLEYAATEPGASHACGHDAHTAILLGVAAALAPVADRLPVGVRLIFQPAEEVMPGGALAAVKADALAGVSRIYALHCDPRLEVGRVGVRAGAITSAADHVELTLESPGGHTSRPHLTGDLVYAMGSVITGLPGILSRRIDPRTGTIMVWGAAHAGDAPNAIPRSGVLRGTVRTGDHRTWELLEPAVAEAVSGILGPLGVRYTLNYRRGVPPVINETRAVDVFTAAISALGPNALADTPQSGGGEDFSWYLEEVPGAMARLGVWSGEGDQYDLHQSNFRLDERALEVGVRTLTGIVLAS